MDFTGLLDKYLPLLKKHWLPLSLASLGMIFFAYGLIGLFFVNQSASEDIVFESSEEQSSKEAKTIFIDIEGAVVRPGLYKLPQDSRIQDALVAAGGLAASADRNFVAKNINLAIKLTDGAKIYIPNVGEAVSGASALNASSQVNINTSSQSELEALPGIGPVTAQKIIGNRPYGSADELLKRKIVGSKVFDQIKDKITVY
ncbi:MAG: ComEA family DNA-binding protein [Candidatus Levybacteria bacterium]|nr:ComEA family DNA-binding protein [Candidatus Levybacteria bacterium]